MTAPSSIRPDRGNRATAALAPFAAAVSVVFFSAFAPAAQAGPISATLAFTGPGVSAGDQSVAAASDGTKTVVWKQNQGDYKSPTGDDVRAMRIIVKRVRVVKGTGRKRKVTYREDFTSKPFVIYSQKDRFIDDVDASTTPSGETTVVWTVRGSSAGNVRVLSRRISRTGRLSGVSEIAPAGTRATEVHVASSANGVSTVLWRSDDGIRSWFMARRLSAANRLGTPFQLTPKRGAYFKPVIGARQDGSAQVVWRDDSGINAIVQTALIDARGRKHAPINLGSASRANNDDQAIAIGPKGVATITWSEWDEVSTGYVRMTRIDSSGRRGRTIDLSSAGGPYLPAVGVAANGTATIAWDYYDSAASSIRVRMIRVNSKYQKGPVLNLGTGILDRGKFVGSLVRGFGPTLAVAPNGSATLVWSVAKSGTPAPVDLQAVRVDTKNRILTTTLTKSNERVPDLVHLPVLAPSSSGMTLVTYLKRFVSGSEATVRLVAWAG